ncbi:MAG: transporter substrate-binding domain-containing protein, partial [Clostridia bacterium]|nr:transporter substrate-binding domain-containing protein [Clostridia bacterium]
MKKSIKVLAAIMCVALIVGACFALVACNGGRGVSKRINMLNVELSSEQYAFIFNKSNTELKAQVNNLLSEKAGEIEAIKIKYLNATEDELNTFGAVYQTESSNAENEFVVATNLDFAPFEYKVGNKIAGIDMEIAKLLADALNKTLVVVHMDFDAVVETVATQASYDIGMAALTETEDRAAVVDFSEPYYDTTQVIITKNDNTVFDYCTTADEVKAVLAG